MMRVRGFRAGRFWAGRFWAGRFWAGILAAILLLGGLDWHPAGESPHSLLPGTGGVYFPGAEHPEQPVHFDASHAAERPPCPVCLHQRQTTGVHLLAAVLLAPPAPESASVAIPDLVPASAARRSSGARGPPSLS